MRKIYGKNICPPKQYLNGKNGTTITDPKDIANEHATVFTDNSSSAHYSATFQAIKGQEEVKIDFTSDNTEVYNKPFRLRDLRRSIMKAKPRAPGPDGTQNNLLKHLPQDTLKILKEILNKLWISADFPQQWRAATVIPIPKPNKDHTDPLSYRSIALTSCLCKVLERMINTLLIWNLEKHRILDRSLCSFRKYRSTTDHLVNLERYLWDAFAQRQQAVGLFFDLEKAYETTWQYGIIRDLHRIGFRGRLPVFLDNIEIHLQQAVNAIQEWATKNGISFAAHKSKVKHFTAPRSWAQRPPIMRIWNTLLPVEESKKFLGLRWDSHLAFKKRISVLKTQCKEAQPHPSGRSLEMGRGLRQTMVALCMAQPQTPTCDNWTAFITLDWGWRWKHSAPAQCPACTQRPTKLLWRNVG